MSNESRNQNNHPFQAIVLALVYLAIIVAFVCLMP